METSYGTRSRLDCYIASTRYTLVWRFVCVHRPFLWFSWMEPAVITNMNDKIILTKANGQMSTEPKLKISNQNKENIKQRIILVSFLLTGVSFFYFDNAIFLVSGSNERAFANGRYCPFFRTFWSKIIPWMFGSMCFVFVFIKKLKEASWFVTSSLPIWAPFRVTM